MKAAPVKSLNELVESGMIQLTRGKIISKKDIAACPGSYPIYSSAKDNDGKFGEYGKFLFDEELITWSVDGGGRLFHRPKHKFSVTNVGGVLRILDKSVLEYRYLYYALTLRHSDILFDWVKKAHPSVIKKLYTDIPVPPLAEQQRIVGILDEAVEGIATATANAEKNLHNARALFESHLQSVFTQRGKGWVEKRLAELCDPSRIITYGVIKLGEEVPDGVPCLRTSNVRWLRIETDGMKRIAPTLSSEYSRTILKGGEVLVNVRGTLGGVAVAAPEMAGWNVSREVAVVPVNSSRVNPTFLSYLIGSGTGQHWLGGVKKGAAYVGINIEDLRLLPVSAPAMDKQLEIVRHLESLEEETQGLASLYQQKLAALDELKKSLLHQAFSGAL